VDPNQRRRLAVDIATNQRYRFFLRTGALEAVNREAAVARWEFGMGNAPDQWSRNL
jgi:hypothetical protein